ncbi:MAG: hypothetical protein WBB45_13850 [Cyclobacteriaceae bacterium]
MLKSFSISTFIFIFLASGAVFAQGSCIDFEALESGSVFKANNQIEVSYNVSMSVVPFSGGTTDGTVTVLSDMYENLDGLMLRADNALAVFKVNGSATGLVIGIKEIGGEIELHVDNYKETFPSIAFMEGSTIGGAAISLVYGTEGQPVGVSLDGDFTECAIGGSQVWLDNLCTKGTATASR